MTEQPLVSIVMNCYNSETFLREAIDSVFAQTFTNWQIVFYDNCSTDSSPEVAKSYGEKVKYHRGETTLPLGAARNKAIQLCDGELIAFLDCDDIWLPERLEKQVPKMSTGKYFVSYAGFTEITEDNKEIRYVPPLFKTGNVFTGLLDQFDVNIPTLMVRRELFSEKGFGFDENFQASEEYNLFTRVAIDHDFFIVDDCLALYRVSPNSLTMKKIDRWGIERNLTLDRIIKENPGIENKYPSHFKEAYARGTYYLARYEAWKGNRKEAKTLMNQIKSVSKKYNVLHKLLYFPLAFWNFVHSPTIKNGLLTRFVR